jgi:hypothetical protein
LKLVSGAILTIAISASAMIGVALVCFRVDTTILQMREMPAYQKTTERFLACQMPDCQVDRFFKRRRCGAA